VIYLVKKKITKTTKKKKEPVSKKKVTTHKKTTPKHTKPVTHHTKKQKKSKKDLITIIILAVLIVAIVIVSILVTPQTTDDSNDVADTNNSDINNSITTPTMTSEEFQEKSLALQLEIFNAIRDKQQTILEGYYTELGLDKELIDTCIQNNDYTSKDINLTDAGIVYKIQKDTLLTQMINVTGTPAMYINGYYISVVQDYNFVSSIIEFALADQVLDLNYANQTYMSDENAEPTLTVIYNEDHELIKNNTLDYITTLTTSEQLTPVIKDFFSLLFEETNVNYVSYMSDDIKEVLETLNIEQIPVFYLEGDVSELMIVSDENYSSLFNELFIKTQFGGYVFNQQVMFDLITSSNIQPINQIINLDILKDEEDYVIGDQTTNVTMYLFTDYDCPFCKSFKEDTQPLILENYVDTNKIGFVVKDFIVHEMSSLFPAVFSRCAQEQGLYLETYNKLYALNDQLGANAVVQEVIAAYQEQIDELNRQYEEIITANQQ